MTGQTSPTDPTSEHGGEWHRRQAVEANNVAFDLLDAPPGPDRDENLLRHAYTAAFHWQRARGATPRNEIRARYLIARALVATGCVERGLQSAESCLDLCRAEDVEGFDLAYALEARARALIAMGRVQEAALVAIEARSVPVTDAEDRVQVERDFADLPWA